MRVHDSQAYRKMDVTRKRIRRVLELREVLLSFQTGFNLVNAVVACAILESISGSEPSSVITEPRYLKLVTVSRRSLTIQTKGNYSALQTRNAQQRAESSTIALHGMRVNTRYINSIRDTFS